MSVWVKTLVKCAGANFLNDDAAISMMKTCAKWIPTPWPKYVPLYLEFPSRNWKIFPFFVTARVTNYFRNNGKEMSTLANYLSLKLAKSLVLLETTRLLDTLKKWRRSRLFINLLPKMFFDMTRRLTALQRNYKSLFKKYDFPRNEDKPSDIFLWLLLECFSWYIHTAVL